MCTEHNAYMAERDYGKEKMDQYRRSPDRVGEPSPTLQLRPDGVLRPLFPDPIVAHCDTIDVTSSP